MKEPKIYIQFDKFKNFKPNKYDRVDPVWFNMMDSSNQTI